jgi:hypothetical protein
MMLRDVAGNGIGNETGEAVTGADAAPDVGG